MSNKNVPTPKQIQNLTREIIVKDLNNRRISVDGSAKPAGTPFIELTRLCFVLCYKHF